MVEDLNFEKKIRGSFRVIVMKFVSNSWKRVFVKYFLDEGCGVILNINNLISLDILMFLLVNSIFEVIFKNNFRVYKLVG